MVTSDNIEEGAAAPDFSGLRALFINCTLKRSADVSNTQALVDASAEIMTRHGVSTKSFVSSITMSPPACGPT